MGALDRQETGPKRSYPGHGKLMQDLKGTQTKIEVLSLHTRNSRKSS